MDRLSRHLFGAAMMTSTLQPKAFDDVATEVGLLPRRFDQVSCSEGWAIRQRQAGKPALVPTSTRRIDARSPRKGVRVSESRRV
jgi:hypothetical protein